MQNISHKILSFVLCVAYVFASCGFVRHVCNGNGKDVAYISLLANNECNYCLAQKTDERQCCHHFAQKAQSDDEDCCEKTVETISVDQNYSQNNNISESIFLTTNFVVFSSQIDPICYDLSISTATCTPQINDKIPLIYHTGQLRL
ncbi:MAG: hypothetical protein LBQ28_08210 [Prevotellaceae bacterium]|jgi:hypothetical protein|nr:hypothetical protein [Prevotellaceae bacterium]